MTKRRITFYLMRDGVSAFEHALDPDKKTTSIALSPQGQLDGQFHYTTSAQNPPGWLSFLRPLLSEEPEDLFMSSASGLLLLKVRGRIFGLTFGYGRSMLDLSKIELQFGLRVALNQIDPAQIRSIGTKTFEDVVVSATKQSSKSAELPTFAVDISRDIMRSVTGDATQGEDTIRLAGADSLVMNLDILPTQLALTCDALLDLYASNVYQENFGWIDHLRQVRDKGRIAELDQMLVDQLQAGSDGSTHLAMPDVIEWEDIDAFKIGGTRNIEYEDLDLDLYLKNLGAARQNVSLAQLKGRHVSVRFARGGDFDKKWSLYQCIISEQRVDDVLSVLIEGRWFEVSETLVEEVDLFVNGLPKARVSLDSSKAGETEPKYNKRIASGSGESLLNLDAKIKRPGGASSGIEFCDLLSDDGAIIHVKRRARSSTLSHLFAQGSISAAAFLNDGTYRSELRSLVESSVPAAAVEAWLELVPDAGDPVDRDRYQVVYAVISDSSRAGNDWLPFFSRLNLMQHGRQISGMGLKVAVVRIPVEVAA